MKQLYAPILFLLALLATPLAHAQMLPKAQKPQMLDRIVAVAEGDVILQSELDQAVAQIRHQYASNPQQLPPQKVLEQQVLQRLILMKLQVQRAQQQGIRVSDGEIDDAVKNVAQQNHMTADQLRQALAAQGTSFGAFRKQLGEQILVQRLRNSVVHDQVQVTDAEIDNLLASPAFKAGEVHLAHIMINIPAGADAQQIQAAATKAKQVEKAIAGGMDFKAAAIRYSDAQDALDGGDLGWRRVDQLPPAFVDVVAKLKAGQVTPPLRGPTGFHILKLVGRRAPGRSVVTEYHARQIMIKPTELLSETQAKAKIDRIYHQIISKHKKFAALAKADSDDDTTANLGGDMGWFQPDAWGKLVAEKIVQLKDGQVSKPFLVDGAWHIIQRLGVRKKDRTEQDQRQKARQAIANRKAEQAYDNYLRDMRASSYVHVLVPALRTHADDQGANAS